MGRGAADLRELQVLPLHPARLGPDAAGDDLHGLSRAHDRHPDAAQIRLRSRRADVAVARLLRVVRGQDADVAGPHLASRRARRGPDGGVGDPRRRPLEARRLRLRPLLAADVPGRFGAARLDHRGPVGRRGRLYQPRRAGADRHEEADRLFVDCAHGVRHRRAVRVRHAGDRGRHPDDAQSRPRLRRAVPVRRGDLRPAPHARDRGLWRAGQYHAALRPVLPAVHHGVGRAAGDKRLRRRVPRPDRRVPCLDMARRRLDHGHHPRRGVHALPLSPRRLRRERRSPRNRDARSKPARDRDADPDRARRAVDGHLSGELPRAAARAGGEPARAPPPGRTAGCDGDAGQGRPGKAK